MVGKLTNLVENYQQLLISFVNKLLLLYKIIIHQPPHKVTIMVYRNILFNLLIFLFFCGSLPGQGVTLSMTVPDQMVAGTAVLVEVRVNTAGHEGFARFQQELPPGITAKPGQSRNADFTFEDQRVHLIWLKLPAGDAFAFTYTIQAHETIKGEFILGGDFSYIEEDDRNEVSLPSRTITITPSPNIDPDLIVDIADFREAGAESEVTAGSYDIACYREPPYFSESDNAWIVNVLVCPAEVKRLARVEEQVPEGFMAESITSRGSIFSFKSGIAKFLWMDMPEDPLFVVSYKLKAEGGQALVNGALKGTFTYMENDVARSIPIIEKGIDLTDASTGELNEIMALLSGQGKKPVEQPREVQQPVKQASQPARAETAAGVVYKVQLRAARKPLNIETFFNPYKIESKISSEFHDGWYKYTTGSFSTYREAKQYANQLLRTSGLTEVFICAYTDGKRISVKRALELTNQTWFR